MIMWTRCCSHQSCGNCNGMLPPSPSAPYARIIFFFHRSGACKQESWILLSAFSGKTPQPNPGLLSQRLLSGRLVYILLAAHPRASRKFTMRTFVETPHVRVMYPGNERLGSIDTILRSRGASR